MQLSLKHTTLSKLRPNVCIMCISAYWHKYNYSKSNIISNFRSEISCQELMTDPLCSTPTRDGFMVSSQMTLCKAAIIYIFILTIYQRTAYNLKQWFIVTNPEGTVTQLCSSPELHKVLKSLRSLFSCFLTYNFTVLFHSNCSHNLQPQQTVGFIKKVNTGQRFGQNYGSLSAGIE